MDLLIMVLSVVGSLIAILSFLAKIFNIVSKIEKDILASQKDVQAMKEDCTEKFSKNEKDHTDIFGRLSNIEQRAAALEAKI